MLATITVVTAPSQTFTISANLSHSAEVRERAREFFVAAGFGTTWTHRLVLVVDELFMNAVKYGSRTDEEITINLNADGQQVTVAITDHGASGITLEELEDKINQRSAVHTPSKTNGRGLAIITQHWTDGYAITREISGGTTITFTKKIEADPIRTKTTTNTKTTATTIIPLTGEIEEHNIGAKTVAIEAFLGEEKNSELTLDLSAVTFVNSIFLGKLAGWHTLLSARGGKLNLIHIQPEVRDILELVGLDHIITIS